MSNDLPNKKQAFSACHFLHSALNIYAQSRLKDNLEVYLENQIGN